MLTALSTPHPSAVCLTLASSSYGGTKIDGAESDANKLPLGQQTAAPVHGLESIACIFHLEFCTPECRIADSKLGTPRARPEQLYSSPGNTSLQGRTVTPKLLRAHTITFSTVPALRDNADNYLLCAPSHLSAASTPVETCTTLILFTCCPCSCTTLLSAMSTWQSSLCCRSRNLLFLPIRHISH